MKKTIFILGMIILMASCDKIKGPYVQPSKQINVDISFPDLDTNQVFKKILFEEYTGHQCPNCPDGHQILEQMVAQYGDTLVPIGIHANWFAQTGNPPFDYDFRTEAGETMYTDFGITSNPAAIINRESNPPLAKEMWQSSVAACNHDKIAAIQIINKYDHDYQFLTVYTRTTMLRNYTEKVQLSLLLVEDNIIKPQQHGSLIDTFYVHNHILRQGINGTYGEIISPNGFVQKDSSYLYGYVLDFESTDWKPENCSVVAILWDQTNRKVLQVEKAKVIQ